MIHFHMKTINLRLKVETLPRTYLITLELTGGKQEYSSSLQTNRYIKRDLCDISWLNTSSLRTRYLPDTQEEIKRNQEYSSSLQTSQYLACLILCVYCRPDEIDAPSRSTTYQTHKVSNQNRYWERKILKAKFLVLFNTHSKVELPINIKAILQY